MLTEYLFMPCLLFTCVAEAVTKENAFDFLPIPIYFLIVSVMAWGMAHLYGLVLKFTRSQRRFMVATMMFSNTDALPLGLIQALVLSSGLEGLRMSQVEGEAAVASRYFSWLMSKGNGVLCDLCHDQ